MRAVATRPIALAAFIGLFAIALAGCRSVVSDHPIGERVTDTPKTLALQGHWHNPKGNGTAQVHRRGPGRYTAVSIGEDDGEFTIQRFPFTLTKDDGAFYVNLNKAARGDGSDDADDGFNFLRLIQPDPNTLLLIPPDVDYFKQAVEAGDIAGRIDKPSNDANGDGPITVHLEAAPDALSAFIKPERVVEQFRLDNILALHRVGQPEQARPQNK